MENELTGMFGRKVDLVERRSLCNPFRRYEILRTRRVVYATEPMIPPLPPDIP